MRVCGPPTRPLRVPLSSSSFAPQRSRSRLPSAVDAFAMPFKISAPTGEAAVMPNGFLPHSRTCFFNLMYDFGALIPWLC